jgi:carbon monoxide dehydrogenase subunit G
MQMQGERSIDASRADVWAALNDADVLKACIPGCETLEKTSPTTFEATVMQKVGPVKARFKGSVELSDIVETEGYTITGEGKGGAAGFAKGGASVRLTDDGQGTLLIYQAEAKVGGKLAQLGSRLIDGFARKMADDFFNRFQQTVEGPLSTSDEGPEASDETSDENKKGWFKRLIS